VIRMAVARAIIVHDKDNVATLVVDVNAGEEICCGFHSILALEMIRAGHKIALCDLLAATEVLKYGLPIGVASRLIRKGEWVHVHNVVSQRAKQDDERYATTEPCHIK